MTIHCGDYRLHVSGGQFQPSARTPTSVSDETTDVKSVACRIKR